MKKLLIPILLLTLIFTLISNDDESKSETKTEPATEYKETWAKEIKEDGLPNFRKVNDKLYRSAQPTSEGMKTLKKMGVKTVINLRSFHTDKDEIGDTGLNSIQLTTKTWHIEEKEILTFLKAAIDPEKTPVLVHCMQGVDRTGTMCAIYRIVIEGWDKKEAIAEMKAIGHNTVWKNLPEQIEELDVADIRKKIGLDK